MTAATPLQLRCPYPTISDEGHLSDGYALPQHVFCIQRCRQRLCQLDTRLSDDSEIRWSTCPHGFSYVQARIGSEVITANGVFEQTTSEAPPELRRKLKTDRKVKRPEVEGWIGANRLAESHIDEFVDRKAKEAVTALHDIKAGIGALQHSVEALVYEPNGSDQIDSRGFPSTDPRLRTVYESVQFLGYLLQATDIIANPSSASFGPPQPRAIYKLVDLLVRVFTQRAASKRIRLALRGSSFNRPRVHESFAIIPFVLLDNAIKYSTPGSEIAVQMSDRANEAVMLRVQSTGVIVPEASRQAIFERGVRGPNARGAGSGLGLYIASIVAEANQCVLKYECDEGLLTGAGDSIFACLVPGVGGLGTS